MILQCDQCNTKFRLDDSKLKPGGVKVRCSKCRHVFLAGAEQKQEESEFDALLSGLGASAPAKTPEVSAPVAAQPEGGDLVAMDFGAEPAEAKEQAATGGDFDFGDFDLAPQGGGEPQPETAAQQQESPAGGEFDFGDIDFGTGTAAEGEPPAQPAGGVEFGELDFNEAPAAPPKEAPAADTFGFGEFSFDETPAAAPEEKAAPAAADALDFGELSFDETPVAKEEQAAPAAADAMDFGEFSFEETPSVAREEKPVPAAADALDFGEFSFEETPGAAREEKPAPAAADALDFGEFSLEETPGAAQEEAAPAAADATDFGEFSFEETPVAAQEEKRAPAAADAVDFGEFSFEEEPPATEEKPASAAAATMDFGDFSFEEPPGAQEAPVSQVSEGGAPVPPPGREAEREVPPASEADEEFSFGEFSFAEEPEPEPAPKTAAPAVAGAAGLLAAAEGKKAEATTGPATAAAQPAKAAATSPLDFSFGDKSFATPVPEEFPEEEELPPLSIVSRRKGRSAFTIAIVAISVIVVLALSAAGLYMLQSGPAALEKLDKFGIGFVAKWFGMEIPEEGRIAIRNPLASYHQNKEAGELFVVTGEAVNSFRKSRASIQVKVSLFDKSGKVLVEKTAYCGNRLSDEQLATLPMEKIESIMNNQFGDSLSNLGVKPGQPIGFVVALANVPKEAEDFGVSVIGSTVAAAQ